MRSASFNLENFAVGHLPMLRLVAKRVTGGGKRWSFHVYNEDFRAEL